MCDFEKAMEHITSHIDDEFPLTSEDMVVGVAYKSSDDYLFYKYFSNLYFQVKRNERIYQIAVMDNLKLKISNREELLKELDLVKLDVFSSSHYRHTIKIDLNNHG